MPSTMIHLYTGFAYLQAHSDSIEVPAQFYLGCIAPDSVNVDGFAEKSIRWEAHLRDHHLDVWTQNALDFYESFQDLVDEDFLRGYTLHLLTDIEWDRLLPLRRVLTAASIPDQEHYAICRDEYSRWDKTQFSKPWWQTVAPQLQQAAALSINNITRQQMSRYLSFLLNDYEDSLEAVPPVWLRDSTVTDFAKNLISHFAPSFLEEEE